MCDQELLWDCPNTGEMLLVSTCFQGLLAHGKPYVLWF